MRDSPPRNGQRAFWRVLAGVLAMQIATLLVLWFLQAAYHA